MPIDLLTNQFEANAAFRLWVDALLAECPRRGSGWWIEGAGLLFTNYGWGSPGTVEHQVMLGVDEETGDGTVKIVTPDTSKGAGGRLTAIGRDEDDRLLLLRVGRLKKNRASPDVGPGFAASSGLHSVEVRSGGRVSKRSWFVVADLDAGAAQIVRSTAAFTLACARARAHASPPPTTKNQASKPKPYGFGLDERGRVMIVKRQGGTSEVRALQGYVFEELRREIGPALTKPARAGYAADGMVEAASILIEIKTGSFAHHCYEAVGQLALYPALIGLDPTIARIALVPEEPTLRPMMAAAMRAAGVEVYTYSVSGTGTKPVIRFSDAFLSRCRAGGRGVTVNTGTCRS